MGIPQLRRDIHSLPTNLNLRELQQIDDRLFSSPEATYLANAEYIKEKCAYTSIRIEWRVVKIVAIASWIFPPLGLLFLAITLASYKLFFEKKLFATARSLSEAEAAFLPKLREETAIYDQIQLDLERGYSIRLNGQMYHSTEAFSRAVDLLPLSEVKKRLLLENCHQGVQALIHREIAKRILPLATPIVKGILPDGGVNFSEDVLPIDETISERILSISFNWNNEPIIELEGSVSLTMTDSRGPEALCRALVEVSYKGVIRPLDGRVSIVHDKIEAYPLDGIPFYRDFAKILATLHERLALTTERNFSKAIRVVQNELKQLKDTHQLCFATYQSYMVLLALEDSLCQALSKAIALPSKHREIKAFYPLAEQMKTVALCSLEEKAQTSLAGEVVSANHALTTVQSKCGKECKELIENHFSFIRQLSEYLIQHKIALQALALKKEKGTSIAEALGDVQVNLEEKGKDAQDKAVLLGTFSMIKRLAESLEKFDLNS